MRSATWSWLALSAVVACADGTAPVVRPREVAAFQVTVARLHDVLALDLMVNNTCAAELVRVTGALHILDQRVTMDDGEIRATFHTNLQDATGIGQVSGDTYRATHAENATWQGLPPGPPGGPWRTSHQGSLRLVAPRAGASFNWHFVFVVTKEPGAAPQLIVFKNDVTCH